MQTNRSGPRAYQVAAAVIALIAYAGGCASPRSAGKATSGPEKSRGRRTTQTAAAPSTGLASYYAARFDGRKTANGETFSNRRLTAAHRTLPFGTRIRVTSLANMRSVIVRVNDRGPFVRGRVVDLSRAAAEKLDMVSAGIVRVRLDVLGRRDVVAAVD